ncbi:MAG: hydrogenase formation protein HypD [Bacillota bacterium]
MKTPGRLSDPGLGRQLLRRVQEAAARAADQLGRPALLMEVCGTHTMVLSSTGLRGLLAGLLELRSGPGCPVCVTPAAGIEALMELARLPGVILATFGDMIRVPGQNGSLELERARGARVQVVYSPSDAAVLARENPNRQVILAGVGFETTAPMVAASLLQASSEYLPNFSVYSLHKLVPPVMRALLETTEVQVDGFILPGHVSAVTGSRAFDFIGRKYNIPAVVAGFTPVEVLAALHLLLGQILSGTASTANAYPWVVREEGNKRAREVMETCFYPGDSHWRGLGQIQASGLLIRDEFARYDAGHKFKVGPPAAEEPPGCRCGELLRGVITPLECALYGQRCTPASPVGPCMVSSEGACAAYLGEVPRRID